MRGDDPALGHDLGGMSVEFPACAGMIRFKHSDPHTVRGVPRMRGDDPDEARRVSVTVSSSPHARG